MPKILVTGAAGFVGHALSAKLLELGHEVIGIDNLNNYYDVNLKQNRLNNLTSHNNFSFYKIDIADRDKIAAIFIAIKPNIVVNLAAQAGVRYSLEAPEKYIDSNVVGFANILEGCRHNNIEHLLYASSSSVYGANTKVPYSVTDAVDHPVSLYAATKRSNELMAYTYSHLYQLPITGLRFFTVYGPWGRPDMSPFLFAQAICSGKPIKVFNYGDHRRDFTYIDDIVESINRLITCVPGKDNHYNSLYNIGNNKPVALLDYIALLEKHFGKEAQKELVPAQPGDVHATHADIDSLVAAIDYQPQVSLDEGIGKFVAWYKEYYS
ncbi:MAG: capsular biosynthesis protein CpsI [Legionellales bacterium]|nr:MAG: capsular biosynthesis protein CpsI [Legionellales bacterium]